MVIKDFAKSSNPIKSFRVKENIMAERRSSAWVGILIISGFIVGLIALFAGILSVINEFDYIGAGLCFLASAFAFGLLANSILRN